MDYAEALTEQNSLLGKLLLEADWSLPVPTCPGWTLLQLLRHVGRGDRWAAQIITDRAPGDLDPRLVRDGKPPADVPGAVRWLTESPRVLLDAVESAGADTTVSTFLGPRPAAWWVRRRLHEAAVHRVDASIALDAPCQLPADVAADGISEWLDRLADGQASPLPVGRTLVLRATDPQLTDGTWTIRGVPDGLRWDSAQPDAADLTLTGPAEGLLLALLRRRPAPDAGVSLRGDVALWDSWLDQTPL